MTMLTLSYEAVAVYENVDNNKGGRQQCQPPLVLQMIQRHFVLRN